jgi:glyoxylase-like metal-dependent hydrolase (beta-lactamase superfamily II)
MQMERVRQGTGFVTMRIGQAEVTALHDGYADMPLERLRRGGRAAQAPGVVLVEGKLRLSVNAYLVRMNGHVVLVDTGSADAWHPTVGRLSAAMAEAGVDADAVQVVVLTHTHVDHISGLKRPDGRPAFPQAEVRVPVAEVDLFRAEARMAGIVPRGIAPGDTVVPGMRAVAAFGHEVGHTAYLVEGLLIWGDVVHVPSVQFADPGLTWAFDTDPAMAHATRLQLMARAVADGLWVAGAHLDFPGVGRLEAAGDAYRFVPV